MPIRKLSLFNLLLKYDLHKGWGRRLFGDSDGIKALREFVNKDIGLKPLDYKLSEEEIRKIISILVNRFIDIKNSRTNYRNQPKKLTNVIYRELAHLVSDDPQILALTQIYKNDYTPGGFLISESEGSIFLTKDNYAIPLNELEKHILSTKSLTYSVFGDPVTKAFSPGDIDKLKKYQSTRRAIVNVEQIFSTYKNQQSFSGEDLIYFPKDKLFITKDKFCFLIEECVGILKNQIRFYNPYTNDDFYEEDIQRLLQVPQVSDLQEKLVAQQAYCAANISKPTIQALATLAEDLLNQKEIKAERGEAVPIAQQAYERFDAYYKEVLPSQERECLNNYWIDSWNDIETALSYLKGCAAIKFKDLYSSVDESCVHTVAGSIIKLVTQLDPEIKFNFDNKVSTFIGNKISMFSVRKQPENLSHKSEPQKVLRV